MSIQIGNIICAIMDIVEALFFYSIFFERKDADNKKYLIYSILASVISIAKLYINIEPIVNLCISLCVFVALGFILYKGSVFIRLTASCIYVILVMLSETVAQFIIELLLGVSYNDVTIDTQALFAPLTMAIIIIILIYTKKVHKKQFSNVPLKYLIPIMLIPVASLAIILIVDKIIALSDGEGEKLILPLVLMLLYVSFITFDYIESYSNKIQLEAAQEIIEKDRENYKILEENERELRDLRHDIRKYMEVIRGLNGENKDSIDIKRFVTDLENVVSNITSVSYTGNETLDSILNIKGRRAKALDIKYFVKSNISSSINISEMDLSTILCNTIDNAIEGSFKTEEASIVIYIESNDEYVKFLIENTANEVVFADGKIETSKKDKKNHGRGIRNIQTAVLKYGGKVRFDYDEGVFIVDIEIPN